MSDDRWVIDFTVDPEIDFNLKERLELYKKALSDLESNKDFDVYEMKLRENETQYLHSYDSAKKLIEYFYNTLSTQILAREDVSVDIDINIDKVKADKILQEGLVKLTPDIAQEDLTELSDKLSQGIIARYKDYFVLPMLVDDKPVMPMSEKSMDDITTLGIFNRKSLDNEQIYFFTPQQALELYQDNLDPKDDLFNIFSPKFRSMFKSIKKRKEDILKQGIGLYEGREHYMAKALTEYPIVDKAGIYDANKYRQTDVLLRSAFETQLEQILASLEISKEKNMNVVIPLRVQYEDELLNYEDILKIPTIDVRKYAYDKYAFAEVDDLDAKNLLTYMEFQKYKDLKENIPNKISPQEIRNMSATRFLTEREERAQKQKELRENKSLVNERMTVRNKIIDRIKASSLFLAQDMRFRKDLDLLKEQEYIDLVNDIRFSMDEIESFLKEEKILFEKRIDIQDISDEYTANMGTNPIDINYLNRLLNNLINTDSSYNITDINYDLFDDLDALDTNTYKYTTKYNSTSEKLSILTKNIENEIQRTDDYKKIYRRIADSYTKSISYDITLASTIRTYGNIYSQDWKQEYNTEPHEISPRQLTEISQNTYKNIRDKVNKHDLLTKKDISYFLDQVKGGELEIDLGFIMTGGGENFNQLDEHTRQIINTYIKEFVINTLYKALD